MKLLNVDDKNKPYMIFWFFWKAMKSDEMWKLYQGFIEIGILMFEMIKKVLSSK